LAQALAEAAMNAMSALNAMNMDSQFRGDQPRTDLDIANDVANALLRDADVPDATIGCRVHDRWVWLVGAAERHSQRVAAERAVAHIPGIKGVTNLVRLDYASSRREPPSSRR
jgi:osmotically-inducible protein OsmY